MKALLLFALLLVVCVEQFDSHVMVNDCQLGRYYWCLSVKIAKKCKKLEECFPSTKQDDYILKRPIQEVPPEHNEFPVIKHNPYGGYIG